ncbi:very short patch repair endonuclease [Acidithiobacillus ferrivorans]|uniref:very short patch repair endonuclease n=1 Tax=Acidithiobacillus ferrivorans TaxID=160808 RepID=UPI001C06C03F|nr:very short patch repair endonuclease [Acidithiobacillus ferrivorans]
MDTLDPQQRSARMALVRSKNTKPELVVRRLVHALGYRYRLHRCDLPGTPDLVFAARSKGDLCSWLLLAPARRLRAC